ncbi:MAG TPA: hypothetical protein HPP77_02320, partial [Candidatus Hydrogenedentes bacterium]|nr:hypothetical protein [Candidatus Hydrogenedentota bacterium]
AAELYAAFLAEHPGDDACLHGLGYALLAQGEAEEALAHFERIVDSMRKAEGVAAVAYETKGEDARETLESAREAADTAYPDTLLANLELLRGRYESAAARLANATRDRFYYDWQYAKCLQALGQAYYRLSRNEQALDVFGRLGETTPAARPLSASYVEKLRRIELDDATRDALRQQIREVAQAIEASDGPSPAEQDAWTSRPLRFFVLPPEAGNSRLAFESGLADVLPLWLERALVENTHLRAVDRRDLDQALTEQELSAYLASEEGKLYLRKILTARLFIAADFYSVFGEDSVIVKITDTESSIKYTLEDMPLTRPFDREAFVTKLRRGIWQKIAEEYPVRGKVSSANGRATIDIGEAVGVTEGMRFVVAARANAAFVMEGKAAVVDGVVESDTAPVRLEGFSADTIPSEGWYVIDETWYRQHGET